MGIAVAIIDLSTAFNCVSHNTLLLKLKMYGAKKNLIDWLSSYLFGRKQVVVIGGEHSSEMCVDQGVPQGSILGPILFTIYVNELPSVSQLDCNRCDVNGDGNRSELFSEGCEECDDTTIVIGGNDLMILSRKITGSVGLLAEFLAANDLRVNELKTHTMAVMPKQKRIFVNTDDMKMHLGENLSL